MSTLPDLDTSTVGFIAYWNAIDQGGASDIAPDEVLSDSSIASYTLYDNGVTGKYTLSTGREASFRVKGDGWFVVYIDNTDLYRVQKDSADEVRGQWDLVTNWNANSEPSLTDSTFDDAIGSMVSELSNSGNVTFVKDDVGIYNYEYTDATTVTGLLDHYDGSQGKTYSFSYTAATNRTYHSITGYTPRVIATEFVNDIAGNTLTQDGEHGSVDVLAQGQAPNPGTEYSYDAEGNCTTVNLIMWY